MSVEPLPVETSDDGVCTVLLEQPGRPVVVLELELIQRLEAALKSLPRDIRGMVLASASERVFVAGADLKSIQAMDDEGLHRYLEYGAKVFGMICDLPCPTAAAINGAALGGGLELAMHCDVLIGAPSPSGKPYPVGLPEAGLSICPGWGGTNLLPARIDAAEAIRRTATGKPYTYDEAVEAGLFERVVDEPDKLRATAAAWCLEEVGPGDSGRDGAPKRWVGRPDRAASSVTALDALRGEVSETGPGSAVVDCVDIGLTEGWQAALGAERRHLVRLRTEPAGKAAIEAFLSKSK
ncbi:MAG: enoyl-CoA hydratase/isomerase family protein [Planctomycetota bacterium]